VKRVKPRAPRVAVIFNRDFEDAESDPENRAREDIQNVARDVMRVLETADHPVRAFGVREDVYGTIKDLKAYRPAVVFNLCESLRGDNRFEALMPLLLDFEGLVYTGSAPQPLLQALHKDKAKQQLLAAGVSTPRAVTIADLDHLELPETASRLSALGFPLIVKPTREDASVGIASASVVRTPQQLSQRVRHVLTTYRQPTLVEQFIEGREINVSILDRPQAAGTQPEVLPLHEIDFGEMPADRPHIVSFEGKWVEDSAEFRGTRPVPCELSPELRERVASTALQAFQALDLRDYGRVDLRLDAGGQPWVIDVNPNCDLSGDGGGFARAARAAGLSYADLVLRLLALAMNRRQDADTIPLGKRSGGADRADRSKFASTTVASTDLELDKPVSTGGTGVRHRAPRGGAGSA
jgi:D-alanine-D-alanine ligase